MTEKSALRAHYLDLMKRQAKADRIAKSSQICQQLLANPAFLKAKTVLLYAALPGEVETFAMITETIKLKKITALPIVDTKMKMLIPTVVTSMDDLREGSYGILEPNAHAPQLNPTDLDVVVVPGLAFDRHNNRLGRGIGYYDRFLSGLPGLSHTIGLAFDFQISDCLPVEGHDVPVNTVIAA